MASRRRGWFGATLLLDNLSIQAIRGQSSDLEMEHWDRPSIEDCLRTTAAKSASLTRCAAAIGATLACDDDDAIEQYADFGWQVGVIAQLMNDIDAVRPGGSAKSDIARRKKTLPIVFVLGSDDSTDPARRQAKEYLSGACGWAPPEQAVRQAIWDSGSIHRTWAVAEAARALAFRTLDALAERHPGSAALRSLFT